MDINAINGLPSLSATARSSSPGSASPAVSTEKLIAAKAEEPTPTALTAEQARQPVEEAISSIKQFAQSIQRNLNFALDDSSGRVVVKVTDAMSGDVIRQIPSEDALRLAESLEEARSLLFKAEA
ncbi:flagellar protein FlaG [Pseudomonas spirodelae]|uniref:Flagellar protein FlaG n=1 Tax=Pseudomonas spirodelae TaxID=3101751 RepID=A0ABU5P6N9_9PSED|nr:flagellar protein FlaG [Pseudomonas sp. T5W1]MEA1605342.1 flagellar protein FlaG [Pseudomonas sp. T5W1]